MCAPQIVTYSAVDKGMELRGKPMMQALELLRLVNRHVSRQSNIEQ